MEKIDLEAMLEDRECECGHVGLELIGGDTAECPVCGKEYDIFGIDE